MGAPFELFTDIFAARDSFLGRLDARVKLVVALSAVACVVLSRHVFLPLALCLASVLALASARVPARYAAARLAPSLAMASVLVILTAFMTRGAPVLTLHVFGHSVSATREGLSAGALLGARVTGAMSAVLVLGAVTPAHEVFRSLRWLGFPAAWVEVAMLTYRYTFSLIERALAMAAAQRLRLGYSGARRSMTSAGVLAGTVLVGAIDQAARTHEAMTLRGYRGEMPWGPRASVSPGDRRLGIAACSVLLAALLAIELGLDR